MSLVLQGVAVGSPGARPHAPHMHELVTLDTDSDTPLPEPPPSDRATYSCLERHVPRSQMGDSCVWADSQETPMTDSVVHLLVVHHLIVAMLSKAVV